MKNIPGNNVHKVFIVGFLVLISLPLIVRVFSIRTGQSILENRRIGGMPSLELNFPTAYPSPKVRATTLYISLVRFVRNFDDYYSNTFGFRSELLRFYNNLKMNIFHTDPLPHKVVRGSDGWFFLGDSNSNEIKESKGLENFSSAELNVIRKTILEHQDWLQAQGIKFYVAVAPNKVSVYGEHLPIQKSNKRTQVEQIDSMSMNRFAFIDLKQNFKVAPDIRLFHKTDSHWNDYGAYLGYTALMERVKSDFKEVNILRPADFLIDTVISYRQDLTNMLSLTAKEELIVFKPKLTARAVLQKNQLIAPKNYDRAPIDYEKRFRSDVNHLKALVLHDSFTTNLIKYVKESFGETVFIWKPNFNKELIEQEKPDIVIQIVVERNLEILRR